MVVTETFKITLNNPMGIPWIPKLVCTQKPCFKKGCWPLLEAMGADVFKPPLLFGV